MLNKMQVGTTVALTSCPAWWGGFDSTPGEEKKLSGLFVIDEYLPREPSAYVWTAGYHVVRVDVDPNVSEYFFVQAENLWEQVDPQGYATMLVQERMMELSAEDWELENRKQEAAHE